MGFEELGTPSWGNSHLKINLEIEGKIFFQFAIAVSYGQTSGPLFGSVPRGVDGDFG